MCVCNTHRKLDHFRGRCKQRYARLIYVDLTILFSLDIFNKQPQSLDLHRNTLFNVDDGYTSHPASTHRRDGKGKCGSAALNSSHGGDKEQSMNKKKKKKRLEEMKGSKSREVAEAAPTLTMGK